jgi:hypothetical protein
MSVDPKPSTGKEKTSGDQNSEAEFDPADMMIQFYDNWTKTWANAMSEATTSKSFAESMGQQMESSLDTLALIRRQVNEFMEQYLQQMSLPTRKEVIGLAERLTKIEMDLDDLDNKMEEALDLLQEIRKGQTVKK